MKRKVGAALLVLLSVSVCARASQAQNVPLAITYDYYAQPKTLIVHALNNSGKDITAYTISIRHKLPDGTLDKGGWSETLSDMLSELVTMQMGKDPPLRSANNGKVQWRAGAMQLATTASSSQAQPATCLSMESTAAPNWLSLLM
jgi:hypothetical protein